MLCSKILIKYFQYLNGAASKRSYPVKKKNISEIEILVFEGIMQPLCTVFFFISSLLFDLSYLDYVSTTVSEQKIYQSWLLGKCKDCFKYDKSDVKLQFNNFFQISLYIFFLILEYTTFLCSICMNKIDIQWRRTRWCHWCHGTT